MEGQEQHILLSLEEKLATGPYHIDAHEIAAIGAEAQPPLDEHQSYRIVNRLHRDGRITGGPTTSNDHPVGWVAFFYRGCAPLSSSEQS